VSLGKMQRIEAVYLINALPRSPVGKVLRVFSDWGRCGQGVPAHFPEPFRGSLASLRGRRCGRRM